MISLSKNKRQLVEDFFSEEKELLDLFLVIYNDLKLKNDKVKVKRLSDVIGIRETSSRFFVYFVKVDGVCYVKYKHLEEKTVFSPRDLDTYLRLNTEVADYFVCHPELYYERRADSPHNEDGGEKERTYKKPDEDHELGLKRADIVSQVSPFDTLVGSALLVTEKSSLSDFHVGKYMELSQIILDFAAEHLGERTLDVLAERTFPLGEPTSAAEIAKRYGCSRQLIYDIERKEITRLKQLLYASTKDRAFKLRSAMLSSLMEISAEELCPFLSYLKGKNDKLFSLVLSLISDKDLVESLRDAVTPELIRTEKQT